MVEPIFDYQFRLILIGDSTVGKSTLLRAFTEGKFTDITDPTVGVDFFARLIEIRNEDKISRVKLQLWDTAGQERFRSITKSYYRNSVGALLVYDITNRLSFEHMAEWFYEAKRHIAPHKAVFELVGCKSDMDEDREVSFEEAKQFADFYGIRFVETSAKTGHNVESAFAIVAREIFSKVQSGEFRLEEGWDGIKNGFTRPRENFHLIEGEPHYNSCC